ncbi:hypothetical protein [Rhodoplanes azumiensis]|uniref:Uncharacterized protein n=1 Tax=Rhodoplanes azumiensis TaxID=1897628 RepID=A0ABW5ANB0_9BRAD
MVLSTVVAHLFDPVIIVIAILCGGFLRHPGMALYVALMFGAIYAVASLSYRPISLVSLAMTTVALLIWTGLVIWAAERRRRIQARENASVETEQSFAPPRPAPADAQANDAPLDAERSPALQAAHKMLKEADQANAADRETDKEGDAAPDLRSEAMPSSMPVHADLFDLRWQTAKKRASAYAPPPEHDPLVAGMTGLAVAVAVLTVFLAFAGLDGTAFASAIAWTSLICFLAPFLYFKHQARQHIRAFARELAALSLEQSSPSEASVGRLRRR